VAKKSKRPPVQRPRDRISVRRPARTRNKPIDETAHKFDAEKLRNLLSNPEELRRVLKERDVD
jgi:hypothetical protein